MVRLPGRKTPEPVTPTIVPDPEPVVGKGRPTPKRSVAEGRRGPVAPPPLTQREALKRSRTTGKSLTKGERRAQSTQRRERMMSGDDRYVLARDRGAVRAYVRDAVDTRRNLAGIVLPVAALSFLLLLFPRVLILQSLGPLLLLVVILIAIIDTAIFARALSRQVAERFPKGDGSGLSTRGRSLGFYMFNRGMLPRRWRVPRPRVTRGQAVD